MTPSAVLLRSSGSLVSAKEIIPGNPGLSADRSQGRTFDMRVIGQGEGSAGAVHVLAHHRDVLALGDLLESKLL
jgi:hypothetical protein